MSTSQKHQDFISEAMKDKPISAIAGIGPTYEKRFEEISFTKAYHLLGQFLLLDKNEELFVDFLKDKVGMNSRYSKVAYDCLNEWATFNI